jgi:hypothetical protein
MCFTGILSQMHYGLVYQIHNNIPNFKYYNFFVDVFVSTFTLLGKNLIMSF